VAISIRGSKIVLPTARGLYAVYKNGSAFPNAVNFAVRQILANSRLISLT
jgi:hypothetical protein